MRLCLRLLSGVVVQNSIRPMPTGFCGPTARMPTFTKLDPNDVQIGRGRAAHEARQPYRDALTSGDAGRIELGRGEKASTVKTQLALASKEVGVKVRSSWEDRRQLVLYWKKQAR